MASKARLDFLLVSFIAFSAVAQAERASPPPLVNWSAPANYAPSRGGKIRTLSDISTPVPFIAISPCRQYNSLNATPLAQGVNRPVPLTGAPCGIPLSAVAVSVNITVFNITGAAGNGVFKVDTVSPPAAAWINYPPTETQRANAGAVALNGSGQIIVQVAQGAGQVDFIVDVNGYYGPSPATVADPFIVSNTTNSNSAAIIGINAGNAPNSYGLWGRLTSMSQTSQQAGVYGQNDGTNTSAVGVLGTSAAGTGVLGQSSGTTAVSYGVLGRAVSTANGVAGVQGSLNTPSPGSAVPAGVRGDATGFFVGVLGISNFIGIGGVATNGSGTSVATGLLGYDAGPTKYAVFGSMGDFGGTGAKYFVEPHPVDASKVIRYVSLEGPESGTYFRGTAETVHGQATIEVPETFRIVTDEEGLTVQLTPIGALSTLAVMSQDLNRIVIKASKDVKFHYLVQGIRRAFKNFQPMTEGREFMPRSPDDRLPEGLPEETKARLITNGTYNPDGSVNLRTAERVGWLKAWAEADAAVREAQKAAIGQQH